MFVRRREVRKGSLKVRLILWVVLLSLIPVSIVGSYGVFTTGESLGDRALGDLARSAADKAEKTQTFLEHAQRDLQFLAKAPWLVNLLGAKSRREYARWRAYAVEELAAFSRAGKIYYQVRYIDEKGTEIVRVDNKAGTVEVVQRDRLQNKANSYYFAATMALAMGELYVSEFDLNREQGKVEIPYQPVLRYATPVFGPDKKRRGILITNVDGRALLQPIRQAGSVTGTRASYLVDQDGYYLVHPDGAKEWGSPRNLDTKVSLKADMQELAGQILGQEAGTFMDGSAVALATRRVAYHPKDPSRFWVVVEAIGKDNLFAALNTFTWVSGYLVAGSLLVSLLVAALLVRSIVQPLGAVVKAADSMAAGEYAARVDDPSTDEIGKMGRAFNGMAERIQQTIEKMHVVQTALDGAQTNMLMCDRSYTIIYMNKGAEAALRGIESELQQRLPGFRADSIVGGCVDAYHTNAANVRRLLDDPRNLPYRSEIRMGPLTMELHVAAILSESGAYLGNVVEWTDVTGQRKAQAEVQRLVNAAGSGELAERIDAEAFDEGFLKVLCAGVNKMLDVVERPLKLVKEAVDSVAAGSDQITSGNEDLSERTAAQASSLEETSATMEEMTATVKQNADNAQQANELAMAARTIAEKGGAVTAKSVSAMSEIYKSSKRIGDIIGVIDDIAFQTNLLALNASVEAARAGEHGRGFAVVAAEVRNLAQRSATSAKEIKRLINESTQCVDEGSDLVNQCGHTLEEIVSAVKRLASIMSEISAASQQQSHGIVQVNRSIIQMNEMTQQNAALVEEATTSSQTMKEQAESLKREVDFFRLSVEEDGPSSGAPSPGEKHEGAAKATRRKPEVTGRMPARPAAQKPAQVRAAKRKGDGQARDYEEYEEL